MIKFFKSNFFFFILLFSVVFIVYGKSINFGITNLDDNSLITTNIKFISNPKNIYKFFFTDCYFGKSTQYYRPVLNITFAIEAFFFKDNLKIYHTTNILLYIFALFIIYIFLSELNFNKTVLKFFILLFSVHPVLSSVPVWIPARNDTLLTIFFLLSLLNFKKYLEFKETKFFILYILFFSVSLFLKETTVLLILLYPLFIYSFNLKISKKQVLNSLFFIVPLLIFYFILRHYAVRSIDISIYFNNYLYYIKNAIVGIMLYIEKIVYPADMPIMLYNSTPTLQTYITNIIVILFFICIYYKNLIDKKIFIFAVSFSLLSILPTFAQEEYSFLAHRLIISLTGILIIITVIFDKFITVYPKTKQYLLIFFIFYYSLFAFCSFKNIDQYKDCFTYWDNAYKSAPNYHLVCNELSKIYSKEKSFDKAIELSTEAVKLKNSFDNYLTYAIILFQKKDYNSAKDIFFQLLKTDKNNYLIYQHLSNIFLFEKKYSEATEYAKKSIECADKETVDKKISSLENIARLYSVSNKFKEAVNVMFELLTYDKKNPRYYNILSSLYEDLNDYNNSIIYIKKALELDPNNEDYIHKLEKFESILSAKH